MANTSRILIVIDRIAHSTTEGRDLAQSIDGLRRLCIGSTPSELLKRDQAEHKDALLERLQKTLLKMIDQSKADTTKIQDLLALYAGARAEVADLKDQLGKRKNRGDAKRDAKQVAELQAELAKVKAELAQSYAENEQLKQHDTRDTDDVWRATIRKFLDDHPAIWRMTTGELLEQVGEPMSTANGRRLTPIMASLGWVATTNVPNQGTRTRTRGYVKVQR